MPIDICEGNKNNSHMKGIEMTKSNKRNDFLKTTNLFKKYDLNKNWEVFSKIAAPKRARGRESMSDVKNSAVRAFFDATFITKGSLSESWKISLALFEGCCYICNEQLYDVETGVSIENAEIQADHIIATDLGGTIAAGNIAAVHRKCNQLKSNENVETYLHNQPEQIQKIHDLQKFYDYSVPDRKTVTAIQRLIDKNFKQFVSSTLAGIQEILKSSETAE